MERFRAETAAEVKSQDDERRAKGIPTTAAEYQPMTFDASRAAELVQDVTIGSRAFKLPAGFQPLAVPGTLPPQVTAKFFDRADSGPIGKLVIGVVTEPSRHTRPESLSYTHDINVIGYRRSSGLLEVAEVPIAFGKVGEFYAARQLLTGKAPTGNLTATLYVSLLDGDKLHSVSATGFAPDDAATLQLIEAVVASFH